MHQRRLGLFFIYAIIRKAIGMRWAAGFDRVICTQAATSFGAIHRSALTDLGDIVICHRS